MRRAVVPTAVAAAAFVALMAVRIPASAQTTGNADVMAALLEEVRGLRAAMEQMASAGPRVQLAMGRLQLQEQRVNAAIRRADDVHERRVEAERALAEVRLQQSEMQNAAERATDPGERQALEAQLRMLKEGLAQRGADLQRATNEESEAAAALATEQSRWTEINQRLDELERALARR